MNICGGLFVFIGFQFKRRSDFFLPNASIRLRRDKNFKKITEKPDLPPVEKSPKRVKYAQH